MAEYENLYQRRSSIAKVLSLKEAAEKVGGIKIATEADLTGKEDHLVEYVIVEETKGSYGRLLKETIGQ